MKKTLVLLLVIPALLIGTLSNQIASSPGVTKHGINDILNRSSSVYRSLNISAWIIIAGQRPDHDIHQFFETGCNNTYEYLRGMGFPASRIYYLAPNEANTTRQWYVNDTSTIEHIQWAIENWSLNKVDANSSLGIYMWDHGNVGMFGVPGSYPYHDLIRDYQINDDLNYFQAHSGCQHVLLIIDACRSGSFIPALSANGRIILTSTNATHDGSGDWQTKWSLFSVALWSNLRANQTIGRAFQEACYAYYPGIAQSPLLDDNGDHIGHTARDGWFLPSGGDGSQAMNLKIKYSQPPIHLPSITNVTRPFYYNISKPSIPIYSIVRNASMLKNVSAGLIQTDWVAPPPQSNASVLDDLRIFQPNATVELTDQLHNGNYSGVVFTTSLKKNTYRIDIFAIGADGGISLGAHTYCTLSDDGIAPADTTNPSIVIGDPENSSIVTGMVNITARGDDDQQLKIVKLLVDGNPKVIQTMTSYPYPDVTYSWNASASSIGSHNITAIAYDMAGNKNSMSIFVTVPSVPTMPVSLQASGHDKQINLAWQAPASDGGSAITNYTIYRGTSTGSESLVVTIGNVLAWNDTGLTNGQVYYYAVAAVNVAGEGQRSSEVSATPTSGSTGSTSGFPVELAIGMLAIGIIFVLSLKKQRMLDCS